MEQFANRPPMPRQDEEQENSVVQPRCAVRDVPAQDMALTIHDAAFDGDVPKVRAHLELGVSINAQNQNGNTPLHIAAREGHEDVVRFLRSQPGVDESLENDFGQKAFDCAKNDDMRAMFAVSGTRKNIRSEGRLPVAGFRDWLFCDPDGGRAVWVDMVVVVASMLVAALFFPLLIEAGGMVAWSALFLFSASLFCLKGLADKSVRNMHLCKKQKVCAGAQLEAIRKAGQKSVRKYLVAGFNPNGYGQGYPLHEAVIKKDPEIIRDLLNYGADPNVKDEDGYTPVFRAVMAGEAEIVKVLRSSPHTDLDVPNNEGQTARAYLHLLPKENPSVLQGKENAPQSEKKRSSPRKRLKRDNTVKQGPSCTLKPPGTLS